MKWKPTCVSRVLIIKLESIMSILRWFEKPVSWPVVTKRAINSAVLGILIFVETLESGFEERLMIETTVRFLDHLVWSFIWAMGAINKTNNYYNMDFVRCFPLGLSRAYQHVNQSVKKKKEELTRHWVIVDSAPAPPPWWLTVTGGMSCGMECYNNYTSASEWRPRVCFMIYFKLPYFNHTISSK